MFSVQQAGILSFFAKKSFEFIATKGSVAIFQVLFVRLEKEKTVKNHVNSI